MPTPDFTAFFANIPSGAQPAVAAVGGGTTTTVVRLDYSLQLRQGIKNCLDQDKCDLVPVMAPAPPPAVSTPAAPNRITR